MPLERAAVAANARAEIARAGVPRTAVARALGISYQALHRRLHAEIAFNTDELAALASTLQVSMRALIDEAA